MIQTVKLARLILSDINVRKAGDDLIEQFAADIFARGVLQNLIVTPVKKPRGAFAVIAGSRRYRALMLLAERGDIVAADYDVPVMTLSGDDATLSETSLAENFQRLAMSPADECRAFQHFLGENGDIDGVAKRFGISRRFVEGRLRLANLAEPIFEALAEGTITLDLAKAYASTQSHERQMMVWNSYGKSSYYGPDTIRRVIANESMKSTDPVALLVGEDAYVAAGGVVDRDLFSDAGDSWLNPEIAQALAADRMESEAKRIGEKRGLAWIRPIAGGSVWEAARGLHRVDLPMAALTEEQAARIEEIDTRIGAIETEMENEEIEEEAYDALNAEYETLGEEVQTLRFHRPALLPPELTPRVGLFLTLENDGTMELDDTYYSETSLRVTLVDDEDEAGDEPGEGGDAGDGDDAPYIDGDGAIVARTPTFRIEEGPVRGGPLAEGRGKADEVDPAAAAPGGKAMSQVLLDQLAVQRRDVLGAAIIANPALALDYMLFVMADQGHAGVAGNGTTIRAPSPQDPVLANSVPGARARDYLAEVHDGLDASWTGSGDMVTRFEAFRMLGDEAKAAWLAWIVAKSFEAKESYSTRQNALQNRLATLLDIDVASWWRPTSENFFDRVPKGALLLLLDEVGGPALSGRHASQKKGEISASCEKLFAGEAVIEAEVKEAALAWVPVAMRFPVTEPKADADAEAAGGDDADAGTGIDLAALIGDDEEALVAVLSADGAEMGGPDDGDTEDGTMDRHEAIDDEADGADDESPHVFGDDDAVSEWAEAAE
ncbi:MAG: ParB/RepB/Spo0J family partition protein [Sphingobium sp.]|uniref:ParB/RepB/Spo0J family partition protein n=1 Tax=Sphingobium sp. TaxID=1912891 RepID=UPI0029B2312C|nr:ParB/RepB/Spo0J family partition protein [Sphingobium sp.]MDX3911048.1 ParB/RepB/Spo0J family partition protein [Sphingobium sp.]